MLESIYQANAVAAILITLSLIWLAAFALTRITKLLRLPNVTGYIISGVLIGPSVLRLIPADIIGGMDFVTDAALTFIAFSVGKYLKLSSLKKQGIGVIVLTLCEALLGGAFACAAMMLMGLPFQFCLLLGAIGSATAPASSIMTIRQYKAKGVFVDTLMQVAALDDAVALIAFSICAAVVSGSSEGVSVMDTVLPVVYNVGMLAFGALLGFVMVKLLTPARSKEHRLALACAFLFLEAGVSAALDVSPMLGAMAMGACYMNMGGEKSLFKQLGKFTPPITILFFVLSGMRLDLSALKTAGLAGVVYFAARILGKYTGAYTGASLARMDRPVRKYLGLALIPQAGVSIGLAVLGSRLLPAEYGDMLTVIILSSSVLYEMIGPACAKLALHLSGAIPAAKPARVGEASTNVHG